MARTEFDKETPLHLSFSMIIVPTSNPGYKILRDTPVLGIEGSFPHQNIPPFNVPISTPNLSGNHCEVLYDNVVVPEANLLGPRGHGFIIAQERLGPGRIFHCMRWLGQAQRAFDLMCARLLERKVRGIPLARKQLMQKHVFDSFSEIQVPFLLLVDEEGERKRNPAFLSLPDYWH